MYKVKHFLLRSHIISIQILDNDILKSTVIFKVSYFIKVIYPTGHSAQVLDNDSFNLNVMIKVILDHFSFCNATCSLD